MHDAAFPEPMQAEALEVVQQVVAAGDGGEEVVDLGGALFAGRIKDIAHAGILAIEAPGIKADKKAWHDKGNFGSVAADYQAG